MPSPVPFLPHLTLIALSPGTKHSFALGRPTLHCVARPPRPSGSSQDELHGKTVGSGKRFLAAWRTGWAQGVVERFAIQERDRQRHAT